jgi:hypothetical protein
VSAKLDPENGFVESIFNYCDRWCERCTMSSRCLLFSMESKRRADHVATGNDPDDLDTVFNDVRTTLEQTKELILQEVSSRGIKIDELEEENVRVDTSAHPLHVSAKALSFQIHHFQRALPPIIANSDVEELYDANGSAKVAWIGLTRCLDALTRIAEILPWMHQEVLPLLNNLYQLIDLLDHTMPGHKDFKRPGFDD